MTPKNSSLFGIGCLILGLMMGANGVGRAQANFDDIITDPETESAIQQAIREATPRIFLALQDSTARALEQTADPDVSIALADWYLSVAEKLEPSLLQEDPEDALRDSWIVLRQVEAALRSTASVQKFGDLRSPLIAGAENARSRIVGMARLHLARDDFQRIRNLTIEEERRLREADPGHEDYFDFGKRIETEEAHTLLGSFTTQSSRMMSAVPGSDLAEDALRQTFGLLGGAARLPGMAVGGFTDTMGAHGMLTPIEHFSETLREFPTDVRENTEIILADENMKATLQSVDGFSESTGRIADAVEKLAEEVRVTMEKFEESQPELRETIRESDVAIRNVEAVLAQAERASNALEVTLRAAGDTAEIVTRFIPEPKDEPGEPSEPFRMESVTEAAEALGVTIAELHQTILSLHDLVVEPRVPELAATVAQEGTHVVDHTAATSRSLVNYILLRLWILFAGCLVLLLIYHVVKHLLNRHFNDEKQVREVTTKTNRSSGQVDQSV